MNKAQKKMDEAIAEWLEARQGYERYLASTQSLFTVFAETFSGYRGGVQEAFSAFREALLKEHEFKHLEVVTVSPRQKAERE
jgi:hypothetical protein